MTSTVKSKSNRKETLHMIVGGLIVVALAVGTATAAISIGPDKDANPAARTLAAARGPMLRPAFGPEDEDCVYAIRKTVLPGGKFGYTRKLECAE